MRLNQLSDNPGAKKARKRVGRGIGSGTGKTAARGHKGQKSRSGVSLLGFEGGQMPLHRRLPKRGFNNIFRKDYRAVNVGRLQQAIDAGKVDAKQPITAEALKEAGVIKTVGDGVRLLAKGELTSKIDITVAGASEAAVKAVEAAGGSITTTAPKKAPAEKKAAPATDDSPAEDAAADAAEPASEEEADSGEE